MNRKRSLPNFPGSKVLYLVLTILICLEAVTILAQAFFLGRAITFAFQSEPMNDVFKNIGFFLVVFMLRHSLSYTQQIASERFAKRTVTKLREDLVEGYFQLGPRFIQKNGTGKLVTLAVEGMEQLKTYLEITIPRMFRTVIIPVAIVIYVYTFDKISAIILVVTVPIVIIFMILLGLAAQKMADKQYDTYRILSNHFIDSLKGLETLKYLGKSKQHEKKISHVSSQYRKSTMKTLRVAFLSSFALDFFTSLAIAFVAVGLGYRLIEGMIVLLPALTVLILAPEYFLPIRQVGMDFHATLDGQVALQQVEQVLAEKHHQQKNEQADPITWDENCSLQLQNVEVLLDGAEKPTLKDIQFSWQGNGKIGIVGESGAGKSTLIDLLAGYLAPTAGSVKLNDNIVNSLTFSEWQNNIAFIPQQPYIFPLSLADNIRFYEPKATDEEVKYVINKIGLNTLVDSMPNGINEQIGEGGRILSGGQEQRVAMARALLSKRPIILLDEPTAHLDIETEYEIKQLMLKLFEDRLVFLATHRLHWMKDMDHILILDDGKIVASGQHEQLLAKNDAYKRLVNLMMGVKE